MRYIVLKMLHQQQHLFRRRPRLPQDSTDSVTAPELQRISQLETQIEERYLSHCEPTIPLHALTLVWTRAALCKMRLNAISLACAQMSPDLADVPPPIRGSFFGWSMRLLGYIVQLRSSSAASQFQWWIRQHFPWSALLNLLRCLASEDVLSICGSSQNVLKSWQQLDTLHSKYPEVLQGNTPHSQQMQAQVGQWTLRAWGNCFPLLPSEAVQDPPDFIQRLHSPNQTVPSSQNVSPTDSSGTSAGYAGSIPSVHVQNFSLDLTETSKSVLSSYGQMPYSGQISSVAEDFVGSGFLVGQNAPDFNLNADWAQMQWVETQFPEFDVEEGTARDPRW